MLPLAQWLPGRVGPRAQPCCLGRAEQSSQQWPGALSRWEAASHSLIWSHGVFSSYSEAGAGVGGHANPASGTKMSPPTGSNRELWIDLVAAVLLHLALIADGELRHLTRSFPRRRGRAEHAAIALAQALFRSFSDTHSVQTICYIPASLFCLLLSIFPCAISPEALFSLLVSLGQQTVIPRSSSKDMQSSKAQALG